ncbi:MAG: type III-B CRISPR module-associated protein Cmr5, partial [Candidatus Magnetoovum sp. WYHC-5]|nr:type III-B CRISPR module-associated protein Cmr5 [Candidatus Magnetoovum sp. WYHC-5]
VEKMIPIAMRILTEKGQSIGIVEDGNKIASKYRGYVASFGPTVIQAGLLRTMAFNNGDENKKKINKLLFEILKDKEIHAINSQEEYDGFIKGYLTETIQLEKDFVLEAVTACKLAMRTFI